MEVQHRRTVCLALAAQSRPRAWSYDVAYADRIAEILGERNVDHMFGVRMWTKPAIGACGSERFATGSEKQTVLTEVKCHHRGSDWALYGIVRDKLGVLVMEQAVLFAAAMSVAASPLWAQCASDAEVAAFVESFVAAEPASALAAGGTIEDALCTQAMLTAALQPHLGAVVGYKVGLTSPPAQERFGVSEPVMGVLYESMLQEDGSEVPAAFGAVPLFEADLILEVGDAAINDATTAEEVMAHISSVHPFIELPDLSLASGEPMTGVTITAMGVGARLGVVGAAIPAEDAEEMLAALADMQVTVTAADGKVIAEAPGAAVLGNPVNSVLWLMSMGVTLEAGDLVSVGSPGRLRPALRPWTSATGPS